MENSQKTDNILIDESIDDIISIQSTQKANDYKDKNSQTATGKPLAKFRLDKENQI